MAMWRARAYYNIGLALDPGATRKILEAELCEYCRAKGFSIMHCQSELRKCHTLYEPLADYCRLVHSAVLLPGPVRAIAPEAIQSHIKDMLDHGYNPIVKGFQSARDRLRETKQVSSSLAALRKRVQQEESEVLELAKQVRKKGKQLSVTTSLHVAQQHGGDENGAQPSPPTPEALRRMTERPDHYLASPDEDRR